MESKKFQKVVDIVNTYYAFALVIYGLALYVSSHSHLFIWVFVAATALLSGLTGYLSKSYIERRTQRHGFRILSDVLTFDITKDHDYSLDFATTVKAEADHLMVYPIAHQWVGSGREEMIPHATGKGQQILAQISESKGKDHATKALPYRLIGTASGDWQYWFVALNPPAYKGDIVEIKYTQEFNDTKNSPKPYLYYFVRSSMKRLELIVKFPKNALPKTVTAGYSKPSDPRRIYPSHPPHFELENQTISWSIERPKKGYCYRIDWQ